MIYFFSDFPVMSHHTFETPNISPTYRCSLGAEILRAGINAVRNLSLERCKKNKIENYSDSAKKERMKNPKTPKMQVTKNNVLIRPQGKINN